MHIYIVNFLKYNPELKATKLGGIAYAVNGLFLWLSYLIFRIINFPLLIYLHATDWTGMASAGLSVFSRCLMSGTTILLFLMSAFWFRLVHQGFIKAMEAVFCPKREDSEHQKKQ